jgi:hypothetical protein
MNGMAKMRTGGDGVGAATTASGRRRRGEIETDG